MRMPTFSTRSRKRSRATHDLAERRRCTVYEARMLVNRWLFERGRRTTAEGWQRAVGLTLVPGCRQQTAPGHDALPIYKGRLARRIQ
jgi:hypothetical protein